MVINMDESRLRTIEQIEQFLSASTPVAFSKYAGDSERYEHITRVLKRFDYPLRNKRERGVLLRYLRHTSGYSRPQVTRQAWASELMFADGDQATLAIRDSVAPASALRCRYEEGEQPHAGRWHACTQFPDLDAGALHHRAQYLPRAQWG